MLAKLISTSLLTSALTVLSATNALGQSTLELSSTDSDTSDWYHVEVIVFANQAGAANSTDELGRVVDLRYPPKMVTIEPASLEELRPHTPAHMRDIEDYLALWGTNPETNSASESPSIRSAADDDFLFKSRSSAVTAPIGISDRSTINDINVAVDQDVALDDLNFETLFETDANGAPKAYQDLPTSQKQLNQMARSIRRSRNYSLIEHKAWLQPILADEQAHPVLFQAGDLYNDAYQLDGTISISRSRFLHVDTNLWLTEFAGLYDPNAQQTTTASAAQALIQAYKTNASIQPLQYDPLSASERARYPEVVTWLENRDQKVPANVHIMQQSRRMRSSTVHFLDHPQFGMIITTERYTPSP